MLTPARVAMGRRVICIDPASRNGAFNALDGLKPASGPKIIAKLRGRTIGAYYAHFGTIAASILASQHTIS